MNRSGWLSVSGAALFAGLTLAASLAEASGTLTIGRREDGTTFDPIKSAQNVDFWVFMNVYDVLVRVDWSGTKLEPGLAESWEVSSDGLVYTFKMRDAKFEDGSPIIRNPGFPDFPAVLVATVDVIRAPIDPGDGGGGDDPPSVPEPASAGLLAGFALAGLAAAIAPWLD